MSDILAYLKPKCVTARDMLIRQVWWNVEQGLCVASKSDEHLCDCNRTVTFSIDAIEHIDDTVVVRVRPDAACVRIDFDATNFGTAVMCGGSQVSGCRNIAWNCARYFICIEKYVNR
jgi:hypothetical protein